MSPNKSDQGAFIHQNGYVSYDEFDSSKETSYQIKSEGNGLYVFVIDGTISVNGVDLSKRDGVGLEEVKAFDFVIKEPSKVIIFDVPMVIN